MKIVKRNGDVVDFDKNKIYQAIKKANCEDPNNLVSHGNLCNRTDEVAYIAESI